MEAYTRVGKDLRQKHKNLTAMKNPDKFGEIYTAMQSPSPSQKLVFQEGKKLDGDYFVASIHEDSCHRMFRINLFELEQETVWISP